MHLSNCKDGLTFFKNAQNELLHPIKLLPTSDPIPIDLGKFYLMSLLNSFTDSYNVRASTRTS